ncbi:hypothetical protein RZS08_67455, partial [Arthrospira platensis SPKY1]|nr:hypothetical protein [Arthrospira platensis SPKY1]
LPVEVINWVDTRVTEQVGWDEVRVGNWFTTFDSVLRQDGYWNPTTQTQREYFIRGHDYGVGTSVQSHLTAEWGDLTDAQRDAVLTSLGFRRLFDFTASNFQINTTVNGVSSVRPFNPYQATEYRREFVDAEGVRRTEIRSSFILGVHFGVGAPEGSPLPGVNRSWANLTNDERQGVAFALGFSPRLT